MARLRPDAPGDNLHELETQIRRYPRGFRRRLRKLARRSTRLGDVLYSFPGLAVVIAAGRRPFAMRHGALRLVEEGRSLSAAAAAADLPFWLRRLPPEAFSAPLGILPTDGDFGSRIVNDVPKVDAAMAMWLRWVLFAALACDENFALWVAKLPIYDAARAEKVPLLPLAAFAWFSCNQHQGSRFIHRGWHIHMGFGAAVEECRDWLDRIVFGYCKEEDGDCRTWDRTITVEGYCFVPLTTYDELSEEGRRMNNCVASYARKVASLDCLIYSVRNGERRVATLEVVSRQGRPEIRQLLAAGNTEVGGNVRHAAQAWLKKQGPYPLLPWDNAAALISAHRWEEIWRPYCKAKPTVAPQLASIATHILVNLRRDINALLSLARAF